MDQIASTTRVEEQSVTDAPVAGSIPAHALYPLFVNLVDQPVVVVGAGSVAERKIETLLGYGARVRVVAPHVSSRIARWADENAIELIERPFEADDITPAVFAIAATDDDDVNTAVFNAAQKAGVLVNVVDVPDLCTVAVPSVLQRGLLQIAVSTSGAAPSLARDIRRGLEDEFPAWWETYVALLAHTRTLVKQRVTGAASVRTPLFEALADGRLQQRIAAGEDISAEQAYADYVMPLLANEAGERA